MRGHAPGELGKLTGIDRIPEVRCLRKKMDDLSAGEASFICQLTLFKKVRLETKYLD